MKTYAFIFSRGGSKGLPKKNIKELAGKPLLCHSIDIALVAPSIDKVFVSTDDLEIAEIAKNAGAVVIKRPIKLADDHAPEWLAWQHAIEWVGKNYGRFDTFVSLPATSPLRSVGDVETAIQKLRKDAADVCIAVTPANRSPYFNMVKYNQEGYVELLNKSDDEIKRRQDAPLVFDVTTVVYVSKPDFILNSRGLFSGKVTAIEVPKSRAVDIDDIYDFKLAEAITLSSIGEKG